MKLIYFFMLMLFTHCIMAQNVGVGVINPSRAKLEVETPNTTAAIFSNSLSDLNNGTGVSIQNYWPTIGFNQFRDKNGQFSYIGRGYAAVQYLDPNFGGLYTDLYDDGFAGMPVAAVKRVFGITQSGKVYIGPYGDNSSMLSVRKTVGATATAGFAGSGYTSYFNYGSNESTHIRSGVTGVVYINDIPGGKTCLSSLTGINTANPVFPLELRQSADDKGFCLVNANTFHNWAFSVAGNAGWLHLYYDGVLRGRFYDNGDYAAASDRRIKTNIHNLPSLLDKVLQLQPVEYEFTDKNPQHKKSIGFIAQDVKKIFPELVNVIQDTATGYKGINDLHTLTYSSFGILAIKAVQEQQQLIQSQQIEIDELKKKVDMLIKSSNSFTTNK